MPAIDPLIRYATDEFTADGSTTDWEISFIGGYINKTHIFAYSVLRDPETGLESDRQDHLVEVLSEDTDASTVRIAPAVANGRILYIFRSTPLSEMLVKYGNPSQLTKDNLNLANRQLLSIIQELADSVGLSNLSIDQQLEVTIDLQAIVRNIYQQVLDLLEAGGIVSVSPTTWVFEGDGEITTFPIPGADVTSPGMYDTYVEQTPGAGDFVGLIPNTDFGIEMSPDGDFADTRLAIVGPALEEGRRGFSVLRGYARPWIDGSPLTTVAHTTNTITNNTTFGREAHNSLVIVDSPITTAVTMRANTGDNAQDWQRGEFVLVLQRGTGKVTLAAEAPASVDVAQPFLTETRRQWSLVALTCLGPNEFLASGDLLRTGSEAVKFTLRLMDTSVLSGSAITTTGVKDSITLPYDFQLDTIVQGGLVSTLETPATSGALVTVQVQVNGTDILATPLTIDLSQRTSRTAATAAVYTPAFSGANRVIPANSRITFTVTATNSAARLLRVMLTGVRAS